MSPHVGTELARVAPLPSPLLQVSLHPEAALQGDTGSSVKGEPRTNESIGAPRQHINLLLREILLRGSDDVPRAILEPV